MILLLLLLYCCPAAVSLSYYTCNSRSSSASFRMTSPSPRAPPASAAAMHSCHVALHQPLPPLFPPRGLWGISCVQRKLAVVGGESHSPCLPWLPLAGSCGPAKQTGICGTYDLNHSASSTAIRGSNLPRTPEGWR